MIEITNFPPLFLPQNVPKKDHPKSLVEFGDFFVFLGRIQFNPFLILL